MATASELTINSATALQMAETIFGTGITVTGATFTGDAASAGIYSGAATAIPGISPTGSGVILSTGRVTDFTNSTGGTNTNEVANRSTNTAGVDGDSQLNAIAGQSTFDAAILQATFVPDGDTITMQFVFSSEEYPEYVNQNVNDAFGVWVNGSFVPVSITVAGSVAIDEVNPARNENFYRSNAADQFNTEMDGLTYVLSIKAAVNPGVANTIKIALGDGGDAVYDSNLLIAAESVQTVTLAMDDTINTTANSTRTFDILANDISATGAPLTITQIMGQDIVAGQTITLTSGQQVRLNADGTITVTSTGTLGQEAFSYTVSNGTTTDVGYVTLNTGAVQALDGIVSGTSGDDLIDASHVGDPDGDRIDNNDATGVQGTSGNDDLIHAGAGNDTVLAGAGNDAVHGGSGNDLLQGGGGEDALYGGDGNDTILGGEGGDSIDGGTGDDLIDGSDPGGLGQDTLAGGAGNDTITSGGGPALVEGGDDRDTVIVAAPASIQLDGGAGGDDFDTLDLTAFGKDRTEVVYTSPDREDGYVRLFDAAGAETGRIDFTDIEKVIPCFTPGTRILTDEGFLRVEELRPGARVLTRDDGFQPLCWIGRRDLGAAELAACPTFAPVLVQAGALGPGIPRRDMMVSPQHRVLVTGRRAELLFGESEVLVAALHLVGRPGITRARVPEVSYLHLLFDTHQIVQSDGLWTESFQPGAAVLGSLQDAARDEVLALFPELDQGELYPAARLTLKPHEVRVLMAA